jgi:hypothetical protein
VLTSRLPLIRYRDIPRFLRWTFRKRLRDDPVVPGYTLDARLLTKTFGTLSAWSDHDAMTRFVHSDQHAAMLADLAGRVGSPNFVDSTAHQADRWIGPPPAPVSPTPLESGVCVRNAVDSWGSCF